MDKRWRRDLVEVVRKFVLVCSWLSITKVDGVGGKFNKTNKNTVEYY